MSTTKTDLLAITPIAANTILANNTGGSASPIAATVAQTLTLLGISNIGTSGSGSDLTGGTVTNAKLANMAADTVKGSIAGGVPADLNQTQLTTLINAVVGDSGSGGTLGAVPAPGTGDAAARRSLMASGLWEAPKICAPEGRLTVASGSPVGWAQGVSAIYYPAYIGQHVPIYDGSHWGNFVIPGGQISMNLDSASGHTGYHQSAHVFDVFAFMNSGVITLGTGPAWTSNTGRGTGAGTSQIVMQNGIWTNAVTIALKIDATATQVSVNANCATFLGSFYATANGATGLGVGLAAASGGANAILGVSNAYNRVRVVAVSLDSTASYTYATNTQRAMNNSVNNRISWIDCLQQSFVEARSFNTVTVSGSVTGTVGLCLNNTNANNGFGAASASTLVNNCMSTLTVLPQLGFNFVQAVENASGATVTFAPNSSGGMSLSLEM